MSPLLVFIGFDPRQAVSFTALVTSLVRLSTQPLAITPLVLETLPLTRRGLTPFTYSRFLVPWLCDYRGQALYLDSDTLARGDVAALFTLAESGCEVMVVKNPLRFEWSSVMLFDCAACRTLTPDYVATADDLMTLGWAVRVGELAARWNHLVGYDAPCSDAKLVHFTQGVPAYPETEACEHADEWRATVSLAVSSAPWKTLMGNSVHAPFVASAGA